MPIFAILSDIVYDTIKENIINGVLPEEEKISETQLAKQLNVSRTSLCGTELKQSDEFSRYDQYFHTLIYNIAGSERLSKLSGLIQDARMRIYLAREWLVEE
ncbi:MAG: GntR family transcriptional regulator [Clostridiales bacterium]|nr:GntR family transcriptional regulator [Candidatus Crickella merdequi]